MKVEETVLPGVLIFQPLRFEDERGYFQETYRKERYSPFVGDSLEFVQDNESRSLRGVLRGLHFQVEHPQAKLIRVNRGVIWDVAVDIDPTSNTFKQYVAVELSADNCKQLFIPAGYAHGFCTLSQTAEVSYKCSNYYRAEDECGLLWNDPELNIDWPIANPILSPRDQQNSLLRDYLATGL